MSVLCINPIDSENIKVVICLVTETSRHHQIAFLKCDRSFLLYISINVYIVHMDKYLRHPGCSIRNVTELI